MSPSKCKCSCCQMANIWESCFVGERDDHMATRRRLAIACWALRKVRRGARRVTMRDPTYQWATDALRAIREQVPRRNVP